jgi:hypothetical protein
MISLCVAFTALAATTLAAAPAAGDEVPAWLKQAAAATAPPYAKDVPGVTLHDEAVVSIGEDGRMTTLTTYAVRILTREGRGLASAAEVYNTDTGGKVRELRAWLIRPDGSVKKYGKESLVDKIMESYDLYTGTRQQLINGADDADVGFVFGYQAITEDRPLFQHEVWPFQGRLPTLISRYTLTLPAGWQASSVTFNAAQIEPVVNGSSYTWEARNLAPIEPEPASPSVSSLAPRVSVSYAPAGAKKIERWADVSRWYTELSDPQAAPDEAITVKARELTANAKTELEKIQAIGRYVQALQYVSIQVGIGGYRPHAATEVYKKQYGDCKDKANLMRAMLRSLSLQAHPVLIYSGDRTQVRQEWASPTQFNHCIIAVKVGDDTTAPSVIQHATLGRLLIFDATDENTPVGDLPDHEQGSFALIAAGGDGALVRMPVMAPEESRLEREIEVGLAPDGSIAASLRERSFGQSAVTERRAFKNLSRPDYVKIIERWIARDTTGAKFSKIEPVDNHAEGRFALDVEFAASRYAQSMMDRLLVFKPAVIARAGSVRLTEPTRKHPVVLEAEVFSEIVRFKLPEGFAVDEMPEAIRVASDFGSYAASYEIKEGQLVFTRKLVQNSATVPAERYKAVREFFGRIRASEESPIVLAKK